jgi:hypothetical protein
MKAGAYRELRLGEAGSLTPVLQNPAERSIDWVASRLYHSPHDYTCRVWRPSEKLYGYERLESGGGGARTHMPLRTGDFKSPAYASFATPPASFYSTGTWARSSSRPSRSQRRTDLLNDSAGVLHFVLPDPEHFPPFVHKALVYGRITTNIGVQLVCPELDVSCGGARAPGALMPKASVDEQSQLELGKSEIRCADQRKMSTPSCDARRAKE